MRDLLEKPPITQLPVTAVMGLSPALEGCRVASLYDSRIAAATHHYLMAKAELQSLLLCKKSTLT